MAEETVLLGGLLRQPALAERFAATPRHACEALARALSAGDLDTACACFSPDACLIAPDGTALHGEAAIRTLLARLIDARAEIDIELSAVLVSGDLALAHERWTIRTEGAIDSGSAQTHHPTLVLGNVGGEWKLAIAAPWGWAPAPPLAAI